MMRSAAYFWLGPLFAVVTGCVSGVGLNKIGAPAEGNPEFERFWHKDETARPANPYGNISRPGPSKPIEVTVAGEKSSSPDLNPRKTEEIQVVSGPEPPGVAKGPQVVPTGSTGLDRSIQYFPPPKCPVVVSSGPLFDTAKNPGPMERKAQKIPGTPVVPVGFKDISPASREPMVEALQCILENRHKDALEHLKKYDPQTQELFLRLLPPVALLTKKKLDELTVEEVAVLHDQLQSLMQTLRPKTRLAITRACFCEWVKGFGDYKPMPEEHAYQGSLEGRLGERVQLYVELRNFLNVAREGFYETHLATTVTLLDPEGRQKWQHTFEDSTKPVRSRTPLTDYHANYSFYVPENLPPGEYRLAIRIEDKTRAEETRVGEKILPLRVSGNGIR